MTIYRKNGEVLDKLELPPNTIINEKDGTPLVLIPEGEFLTGPLTPFFPFWPRWQAKYRNPFPVHVPAYYIALHPVTNLQFKRFLFETKYERHNILKKDYRDKTEKPHHEFPRFARNYPVIFVSWGEATIYCEWAGLRLPKEFEWEKGARGTDGRKFPWGNDWESGTKCRGAHNRGTGDMCAVWDYPEGRSPFGLYQMAGNVGEWCEDSSTATLYNRLKKGNLDLPDETTLKIRRGGAWNLIDRYIFQCNYELDWVGHFLDRFHNTGFRCAYDI